MHRSVWESFSIGSTELISIDPLHTPIARVVQKVSTNAVVACYVGPSEARVSVYRHDPRDPKPWNADHYSVLADIREHLDIRDTANRASTSYDVNMIEHLSEHVHWRRQPRTSTNHWFDFDELPAFVQSVVRP